jgi:hypothetical protein
MPKTKSTSRRKTNKRVRFAKLRKQRITRKLRSRRRHRGPLRRDCSWMNLPMTRRFPRHKGGSALKPAEMPSAYGEIREVIPVVGSKAMYSPETGSGQYYGHNTNHSLPDPAISSDIQQGGGLIPRDLVDVGRSLTHSVSSFYNRLITQPISPSPNVMEQPIGEKSNVIVPESTTDLEKIYGDI